MSTDDEVDHTVHLLGFRKTNGKFDDWITVCGGKF